MRQNCNMRHSLFKKVIWITSYCWKYSVVFHFRIGGAREIFYLDYYLPSDGSAISIRRSADVNCDGHSIFPNSNYLRLPLLQYCWKMWTLSGNVMYGIFYQSSNRCETYHKAATVDETKK